MSEQIFLLALVFLSIVCLTMWFTRMAWTSERGMSSSLPWIMRACSPGIVFFSLEVGELLESMLPSVSKKINEELKQSAVPLSVRDVYGAMAFFFVLGGGLGLLLSMRSLDQASHIGFIVCVFAFIGMIYPRRCIRKIGAKRREEILNTLPFALDLISSSMKAGLDFGAAVRYLVAVGKDSLLKREFSTFLNDVTLGKTRAEALFYMQERLCVKEFSRFVATISAGIASGAPIIDIIGVQANDMRRIKFAHAEQEAEKVPTKMIFPKLVFLFPCTCAIMLMPIYIRCKDSGIFDMMGL